MRHIVTGTRNVVPTSSMSMFEKHKSVNRNMRWFRNNKTVTLWMGCLPKLPPPANENCFWRWLVGPYRPLEVAANMRNRLRTTRAGNPELTLQTHAEFIEHCEVFLELFSALYVENNNVHKAEALAPRLNKCIPWLMQHCPNALLRPSPEEMWYPSDRLDTA